MIQTSMILLTGLIEFSAKGIKSKGQKNLIFVHSNTNIIPTSYKDEKVT